MAKRSRKGGKPVISQIWFRKDNVQLLAWLDHCVEHGDDFKKTVVSHLRSSRDYVYTWDQIYTKLDSIWRSKGEDVSKALMSDVFWKGTCSLPGLEEDLLKEVTVVKQKLKEDKQQEMRYRLRSTSTLQSIPATPSAKRQRKTTSPLSSPGSTPQPPSPSSSAHHPTNPSPAPSWEEQSDNTERTQSAPANQRVTELTNTKIELPSRETPIPVYQEKCQQLVLLREQLEEQSHRIEHLSSLLMGKDNYILELRARMSGTITEFEELKECLSVRAVSDPASLIAQLQYSESYLKQQLAHIQALQSDSEKVENGVAGIPNITIRQRMDKLEKDISDACTNLQDLVGSTRVTTQEILEYGDLLEPLIRRVFNSEVIGMDETFSEDVDVQSSLLRALVAASICASVFEGSVFELLEHDSILLNKYRECLRRKGLLNTVDWLAHKSLMSEPVFKSSVIRYKATELADGMTKTLLQLWPAPDVPSSSTRLAVNQDIDDSEVDEPSIHSITEQFRDVYANALTLKADLLLTGKRFKAVFVQSNTPFNTRVMNKDGYTHHSYRQKNRIKGPSQTADTQTIGVSSETVKLCLFPAIYSIPLPQTPQDSSSDHNSKAVQRVMGYVNFDIADTGAVDSLPRLPISKAVVLSQYS